MGIVGNYSGNPADSDLDAVRHLIGDTDPDGKGEWQLGDDEITYEITTLGSPLAAAVACAESIAARYARKVNKTSGGTVNQVHSLSDLYDHYARLATQLKARLSRGGAPMFGGSSLSRKESVQDDTDRVQPAFSDSQFQNNTSTSGLDSTTDA